MSAILGDPTFWTLIAFCLSALVFGVKGFLFIKGYLEKHIFQIESYLKEAQKLNEDAQVLLHKRREENKNLSQVLETIKKKSEREIKFLSQETKNKIEELLKRSEVRIQKRLNLLEESSLLKIREEISGLIYEGSLYLLKKFRDKKSQRLFIQEGFRSLPKDIKKIFKD